MKIKKIKVLFLGILVISLMLTGVVFATDLLGDLTKEYSNIQSEEEVIQKLNTMSFKELVEEINILGDETDESSLIFHATVLKDKTADVPIEQLEAEILNEKNSDIARIILIQISRNLYNAVDNEVMKSLLEQDDINFEIKRNALLNIYQNGSNDTDYIEKIALGNDERLAFQAIKILNQTDPDKAIKIADDIIQGYNGSVTDKVLAAIKVKANHLAKNSTTSERTKFINFCDSILTEKNNENVNIIADTVIFALSDVLSEETISYIVDSEKIDKIAKSYSIEQNYSVLRSMLTDKELTEKNLNTVIKAMEILPIKQMSEPLKAVMSKQSFSTEEAGRITAELQKTLNLIKENGFMARDKY